MDATNLLVHLGRYNLKAHYEHGSLRENVSHIEIHPQWKASTINYDADIAIIVLARIIQFSMFIRPICFPADDEVEFDSDGANGMVVSNTYERILDIN